MYTPIICRYDIKIRSQCELPEFSQPVRIEKVATLYINTYYLLFYF